MESIVKIHNNLCCLSLLTAGQCDTRFGGLETAYNARQRMMAYERGRRHEGWLGPVERSAYGRFSGFF